MSGKAEGSGLRLVPAPSPDQIGIAAGTVVMTADGALPVDFLEPGDRVVTRSGLRVLRHIHPHRYTGSAIRIREGALGHGRPDTPLVLPAHAPVLIRDRRATTVPGRKAMVIAAQDLADGEFVTLIETVSIRLYDLRFDAPEVIYAEGLEIACPAAERALRFVAE